jgi:uncharacterized protein (DUF983 family)
MVKKPVRRYFYYKASVMKKPQKTHTPGYLLSLLQLRCPRCRTGKMFVNENSYSKHLMKMHKHCPVCGQSMEVEPDFYYGTGYVSYALAVAVSTASFIAWWVIIGLSLQDNRFFWWIGFNAVLLIALQPYLMRLSRTVWLSFFVKYKIEVPTCGVLTNNNATASKPFELISQKQTRD